MLREGITGESGSVHARVFLQLGKGTKGSIFGGRLYIIQVEDAAMTPSPSLLAFRICKSSRTNIAL